MNHWWFVIAAYAVALVATAALLFWSYRSMRSAEAAAEQLRRER
jgi:hypothetical protein